MADLAAHLVDVVLPHVPVRQWVLSLPHRTRLVLAYDPDRCREVLAIFVRGVLNWIRARAKATGVPNGRGGAVCFLQRFDSALRVDQLEHLLRYCARPPIASGRLSLTESGQIVHRLKKPWRDGTTHVALSPLAFLQRLCALVPRPRRPRVTYHGVLAPAASWRPQIVPQPPAEMCVGPAHSDPLVAPPIRSKRKRRHRPWHPWADLMKRVFDIDVRVCPWCGGARKVLACITQPDVIHRILACLNLDLAPPTLAPARQPAHEPAG